MTNMSTLLPQKLLAEMSVPVPHTVTRLAGNANDNYLLEFAGRKLVIKCLGEQSSANAELEGIYRRYLHDCGLPVQRFLKFSTDTYVIPVGSRSYVALDYIEGGEARGNNHLVATSLGSLSGKLHGLDYVGLPQREHWLNGNYLEYVFGRLLLPQDQRGEMYEQNQSFPDFWGIGLPLGIGHGDLHMGNVILGAKHQVVSLIDWEEVGVMPRILDLAGTVQALSHGIEGFDAQVYHDFFQSYQHERPLTAMEKELLPEAIRYRSFIVYVWAATKHHQGVMAQERLAYFRQRYYAPVSIPQLQ